MNYILEHEDVSNYVLASKYVDFDKKIFRTRLRNCLVGL